ncbi:MAG: phage baseplate protein [Lactococcus lactis]|nr:phage baseplate protein [Lactococcus lactis]
MVRQYRIHTDLDGFENKIYDMTNGLIRLYQPSDLGIINSTNIWQSQGIGVMGNNNISHPDIDFKFETFGSSLEENYRIFNEFINSIIKQKYITLEYTNEIGTFYADVQLSKITKTEGYGFDGQFSETISFIPVNMWYVYEQLKFSKVQNGEIGGNTKIYGNKETTVYPNLNLLDGTRDFSGNWANLDSWVTDGTYKGLTVKKRTGLGSGFYKVWTAPTDGTYTFSSYLKSSGNGGTIRRWVNRNWSDGQTATINMDSNFDWKIDTFSISLKAGDIAFVRYEIISGGTDSVLWNAGHKWEQGSIATPWMPSSSEVQPSDYRNYGSYKYDYTYFGEDNIERLSKWKIDDGIFSFTARVVPSEKMSTPPTTSGKNYYGVRFLDEDFNEYTAITFESNTKPESIQFNTDVNDEYYLAQIGTTAVNVFSALNYQRFRTRFIQKGTMELVNVDVVEINVKRKVEFV